MGSYYMLIATILLTLLSTVSSIKWIDCGKKNVKSVVVTGCETTPTCKLPRGTNVNFAVNFTAEAAAEKATVVVHGILAGIPTPFPLDDTNGCKDKGVSCPLVKDQLYGYHQAMLVKSLYPKLSLVVKWELQDPSGGDIFCIEVPVQIVDAAKTANSNSIHHIRL